MVKTIRALVVFLTVFSAFKALAGGTLLVDLPGLSQAQLSSLRVEVLAVDGGSGVVTYQGDGVQIATTGVELGAGAYQVFLEHQGTGLIVAVDNGGEGHVLEEGQRLTLAGPDLAAMVEEIRAKDRAEKEAFEAQNPAAPGTLAIGEEGETAEAGPAFVPGDLLVKFSANATLLDRYRLLRELSAENRNKLGPIGVYRIRVDEETDLTTLIQTHADDPRISYMEVNGLVSIPQPVEADTRRPQ